MFKKSSDIPVLVLGFNRPKLLREVLDRLQEIGTARVYIALDGPRNNAESVLVDECRSACEAIDWAVSASYRFRSRNLGLQRAVEDAITWFFSHERMGIILEDDVRVSASFFEFVRLVDGSCANDPSVMQISSAVMLRESRSFGCPFMTKYVSCWGWATWADRWDYYNEEIIVENRVFGLWRDLRWCGKSFRLRAALYLMLTLAHQRKCSTWAMRWSLTIWRRNGFAVAPPVNLAQNVGCGPGATHSSKESRFVGLSFDESHLIDNVKLEDVSEDRDEQLFEMAYRYTSVSKILRMFISVFIPEALFYKIRQLVR